MMKENMIQLLNSDKKYLLLALICFLYAGFSLIAFIFTVYVGFETNQQDNNLPFYNIGPQDNNFFDNNQQFRPARTGKDPFSIIFGATSIYFLAGGIITLLSGIGFLSITLNKRKKEITHNITHTLLLPNEKIIFELLQNMPNGLTQSKLTLESGLSKVQIHRILKKLDEKGIIEKHKYGATNKIILKNK